jgi:hypothetical protein
MDLQSLSKAKEGKKKKGKREDPEAIFPFRHFPSSPFKEQMLLPPCRTSLNRCISSAVG